MPYSETQEERRAGLLAAVIVGGLGVIACGLYLWALSFEPGVRAALGRATWAYAGWITLTAMQSVFLRWHRRAPVPVFLGVFLLFLVATGLVGEAGTAVLSLPLWFAVFAVFAYARPVVGVPLVAAAWIVHVAWQAVLYRVLDPASLSVQLVLLLAVQQSVFYVACAGVGLAVRGYRERAEAVAERARLVQQSAEARAAAAVAAERNRMARELHDLAAHQLVDVVLAARTAKLEPATGFDALDEIVVKGTAALDTLRSAVTALRADDADPAADEPLTGRIDRILESARSTRGMTVNPTVDPAGLDEVSPAVRQTVERVLAEALANAHAHAPGRPVEVRVACAADVLSVEAANAFPAPSKTAAEGTGVGLIGAAERAALLGGTLTAGPDGTGFWRLALRLPVAADESRGAR